MTDATRRDALDPKQDIGGTDSIDQASNLNISEESAGLGAPLPGQTGVHAIITSFSPSSELITLVGVSGMIADQGESLIEISGAANAGNNGIFTIINYNSSSSIDYINPNGVFPDANSGSITWTQREPYSLATDLNYERTDRTLIKGVPYNQNVSTYIRPNATATPVNTNLTNISGKTTDATVLISNKRINNIPVSIGANFVKVNGAFPYAKVTNITGVPINDGYDASNEDATYVGIMADGYESGLFVQSGPNLGNRIIGRTRKGSTGVDGSSVEIEFRSVVKNTDINTSVAYAWESTISSTIHLLYSFRYRFDQIPDTSFRQIIVDGIVQEFSGGTGGSSGPVDFNKIILEIDGSVVYIGDGDILLKK